LSRTPIVAGNWKMNTTRQTARALAQAVRDGLGDDRVTVVLCPPFPYLGIVAEVLAGSKVALGAQDCHWEPSGAYTGEVSPTMLTDLGCQYVILGHSERRHGMAESDAVVNSKVHGALDAGLTVILCLGETLEERKARRFERVFERQVAAALAGVPPEILTRVILAYEPVWAIGTGHTASPAEAQQAHAFLRRHLTRIAGEKAASSLPILYGGSVKPDNAAELFGQPDVDGGLIGGASLKADQFLPIVRDARPAS
jgi:triosephosphate isomerase